MLKEKISSNKNFGIVFGIFFLLLGIYKYYFNSYFYIYFFFTSLFFFILAFFKSEILYPLNYLWNKIGIYLALIISPIIMFVIYIFVALPTKIILVCLKKDILDLDLKKKTYWQTRLNDKINMNDQF